MIEIKRENFVDVWDEALPLMEAHHLESGSMPGEFNLNVPVYIQGDRRGALITVVARDDGEMIGYATCWVGAHPHCRHTITAQGDALFVKPKARRAWVGLKILKALKAEVKTYNPKSMRFDSKLLVDFSSLLKRVGFQAEATSYILKF